MSTNQFSSFEGRRDYYNQLVININVRMGRVARSFRGDGKISADKQYQKLLQLKRTAWLWQERDCQRRLNEQEREQLRGR